MRSSRNSSGFFLREMRQSDIAFSKLRVTWLLIRVDYSSQSVFRSVAFCDIALVINLVSLRLRVYYQNDGALISSITSRVTCAKHGIYI